MTAINSKRILKASKQEIRKAIKILSSVAKINHLKMENFDISNNFGLFFLEFMCKEKSPVGLNYNIFKLKDVKSVFIQEYADSHHFWLSDEIAEVISDKDEEKIVSIIYDKIGWKKAFEIMNTDNGLFRWIIEVKGYVIFCWKDLEH